MSFLGLDHLMDYDVFPKVVVAGKETEIHIRPQGCRPQFMPGGAYKLVVCALDGGTPRDYPKTGDFKEYTVCANAEGGFDIRHAFDKEQEYFLRILDGEGKKINQFAVYCVEQDLAGRYPFRGDLHIHTCRSDGRQEPNVVCANYRRHGYDFFAITDHRRYYPSLDAMAFYKDVPIEFTIVPGEEVHLKGVDGMVNDVHIVNFGGEYSINALTPDEAVAERGTDPAQRSLNGVCPPSMTKEEYESLMRSLVAEADLPEDIDVFPYVNCKWIFDEIRKANGLGIYAHPNWIANVFHVSETFNEYMMETQPFDAFEVLGGENYYEQNGFQTIKYYEDRAKGRRYPIVGSTDSHNSYATSRNALICSTIVFSYENERRALIDSIKKFYSVAVDSISAEYRLVGESRFVRYGSFLLSEYFPIHDDLCIEEGRLMKQYACGTPEEKEDALRMLSALCGRMKKLREKYFAF